ncbi:hypothetical protein B0H13DRAFT_2570751, partial [Mycena leptocephala]
MDTLPVLAFSTPSTPSSIYVPASAHLHNSFVVEAVPAESEEVTSESDTEDEEEAQSTVEVDSEVEEVTTSQTQTKKRRRKKVPQSMSALEKALELFSFEGSFMQTERYSMNRAANPCLEIEGIGSIGLPLSAGVAANLMSNISAGVLEIPAEQIRFQNPDWDAWLQREVGLVCSELAGKTVRPLYRLRNLVLESHGSELSAPELPPDAVGSLIIVLPCLFTGGQLECRHGVQSKTIEFAPESQLLTSVITAYSGVQITQRSITSGYRLSLTYDILQPTADPRIPSFPDTDSAAAALEQAMERWKEDDMESEPDPVAYFLQR